MHAERGIATEAWAPLGKGSLLTHPTVPLSPKHAAGHPPRC